MGKRKYLLNIIVNGIYRTSRFYLLKHDLFRNMQNAVSQDTFEYIKLSSQVFHPYSIFLLYVCSNVYKASYVYVEHTYLHVELVCT